MSDDEYECRYCGERFAAIHRRRGNAFHPRNLTDHYFDCPVRRRLKEDQRREELRTKTP